MSKDKKAALKDILRRVPTALMRDELERRLRETPVHESAAPVMQAVALAFDVPQNQLLLLRERRRELGVARAALVTFLREHSGYDLTALRQLFNTTKNVIHCWQWRHRHYLTTEPAYPEKIALVQGILHKNKCWH
jgi:hypothetical protein